MSAYIGPNRRREERRKQHTMNIGNPRDRRSYGPDVARRQQALSGVVAGMSAEDMARLLEIHRKMERTDGARHYAARIDTPMLTLNADDIWAHSDREAQIKAAHIFGGLPSNWIVTEVT